MTLNTEIAIFDPLPPREVFDYCLSLISEGREDIQIIQKPKHESYSLNSVIMAEPGQGLPGWLVVHYGEDGPIVQDEEYDRPDAAVEVHIDTAYGYRTDTGAGCGDLHAWFVACVGSWLDSKGVRWQWKDEFDGTWYDTVEDVRVLGDEVLGAL